MSESILFPGKSISYSSTITVEEGTSVLVAVYTGEGTDVGPGPVLKLEFQDMNGDWITASTQPYGVISLNQTVQQFTLVTPGSYRVSRPDLAPWNYNVGVEIYRYNNDGVPLTPTPSPVACNTIPFRWAVVTLSWVPANGEDLDPHMAITNPPRNNYIGWNREAFDENFLVWAGDHQGATGQEAFLIDAEAIKDSYPEFNDLSFNLTAFWYTRVLDGNIKITLNTYSDGTPVNVDHNWEIQGGTLLTTNEYYSNSDLTITNDEDRMGQQLGDLQYDFCAQNFTFNVVRPAVTPTPSPTATNTPTPSVTATVTPTLTRTITPTRTVSPTQVTATPTVTPTRTPTRTPSMTPTITVTRSITPTVSITATPTRTPTRTPSVTPTITVTASITPTISVTPTATRTPTVTPTMTATVSVTPSITPTISLTPSITRSATVTPTMTPSPTTVYTATPTPTISVTPSVTFTVTPTVTATRTPTPTPETTKSSTPTVTPTMTMTMTVTPTNTVTPTITPTTTRTATVTPSVTASVTPSVTPTRTATVTPSVTPTISLTPTITASVTPSITATPTITPTVTFTPTNTVTPTITPTITRTATVTPTVTATVTPTISLTPSVTASVSVTPSITPSVTPPVTATPTLTATPSITVSPSVSPAPPTATPTVTPTRTPTVSLAPPTPSVTASPAALALAYSGINVNDGAYNETFAPLMTNSASFNKKTDGTGVLCLALYNGLGATVLQTTDGMNYTANTLSDNVARYGIAYNPNTDTVLLVNGTGTSTTRPYRKSTDMGATWTAQATGTSVATTQTTVIAMVYDEIGQRFLGYFNGSASANNEVIVIQSTDDGATWTAALRVPNNHRITSITCNPAAPHPVIIATATATSGTNGFIFASTQADPTINAMNISGLPYISPNGTGTPVMYSPSLNRYSAYVEHSSGNPLMTMNGDFTNLQYWPSGIGIISPRAGTWSSSLGQYILTSSNMVMRSSDGQTWTSDNAPTYPNANLVTRLAYSFDATGVVVTVRPNGSNNSVIGYIYNSSAVPTPVVTPTPSAVKSIALTSGGTLPNAARYGGTIYSPSLNKVVAGVLDSTASITKQYAVSEDNGATWRDMTGTRIADLNYSTPYGGIWIDSLNLFVSAGLFVYTSPNGEDWTRPASTVVNARTAAWSPELGIGVVAGVNGALFSTTNWTTFTTRTSNTGSTIMKMLWVPELKLFVGVASKSGAQSVIVSATGTAWTAVNTGITQAGVDIAWSPTLKKLVLLANGQIATSIDGRTWRVYASGSDPAIPSLGYNLLWSPEWQCFVATGNTTTAISRNGDSWTSIGAPPSASATIGVASVMTGHNAIVTVSDTDATYIIS